MKDQYGPWALILGGSEGIGEAFARILAAEGLNLVLVARQPEPLQALAERVVDEFRVEVRTASIDLTAASMLDDVRALTDDLEIGMLIYNAGVDSSRQAFLDRKPRSLRWSIDLTVIGQTLTAHYFGNLMRRRGRGGIILVGSMLAFTGGGGMSVYAAAKAYSHTLAKGLWAELKPDGVDVLGLVVGATDTPAYQRAGVASRSAIKASSPSMVAREGMEQLGGGPLWVVSDAQETAKHLQSLSPAESVSQSSKPAATP